MAQAPLQVDAVRIEPAEAGTRLIDRDPSDGSLRLYDALVTSGIKLSELAGLRSVTSVLVVGKGGTGAEYTTVQSALDAVSAGSSLANPSLVLVGPGVYSENILIEKDGVFLVGLGGATIQALVADATVKIQDAVATFPTFCRLQNLRVVNGFDGEECILLTGGAGSTVGSEEIQIVDSDLLATGVGTYQIRANTVNNIRVQGGTWGGSTASSLSYIAQCARFIVRGVDRLANLQLDYDTGNPVPSVVGSSYRVSDSVLEGNVLASLVGAGSLSLNNIEAGNVTQGGDRTLEITSGRLGNLTFNNTVAASLLDVRYGSAAGAGTLAETLQQGSVVFTASDSEAIVFPVAHPDDAYMVHPETELNETVRVTSKTATGFTLGFSGVQTTAVGYSVLRAV